MWRENSLGNERAHSHSFLMVLPSPEGTEVNALEEGPDQRSCFSSVGHSLTNEGGVMRDSASDLILGVTDSLATPQGRASSFSMSSLAFLGWWAPPPGSMWAQLLPCHFPRRASLGTEFHRETLTEQGIKQGIKERSWGPISKPCLLQHISFS